MADIFTQLPSLALVLPDVLSKPWLAREYICTYVIYVPKIVVEDHLIMQ